MKPLKSVFTTAEEWLNKKHIARSTEEEMTSTNDIAKQEAFEIDDTFKVYICSQQTKGRGRGDNTWLQPKPGVQLLSSWSFALASAPHPISAPLFGLATYEALISIWPKIQFSMKAPNDIYIKDKKCAGILVESVIQASQFRIIVGLGLNVLDHPREIDTATHLSENSLEFITEKEIDDFLDQVYTQYSKAILLCQQQELELADRLLIKKALNKCPQYKDEITDISPLGDIVSKTETTPWTSL